jgi:hypothetical protein
MGLVPLTSSAQVPGSEQGEAGRDNYKAELRQGPICPGGAEPNTSFQVKLPGMQPVDLGGCGGGGGGVVETTN